jgi:hypothetical protein
MQLVTTKGALGSGDSESDDREGAFRGLLLSTSYVPARSRSLSRRCRGRGPAGLVASLLLFAPFGAWADADPLDPEGRRLPPQVIYNYGENETTRSAAMGGALRALGNGTSAVLLNPADMLETRVYHAGGLVQGTPETKSLTFGSAIVDSVTGKLAGGLSLMGGWVDSGDDPGRLNRSLVDVRVALAYPITDRIFLGVAGRYAKISQLAADTPFSRPLRDDESNELIDDAPFSRDLVAGGLVDTADAKSRYSLVNELTFDAGLTIKATDNVYLGALGQNLTYPNHGLLPTIVGGGIGFGNQNLSIEVDALADLTSWGKPKVRAMIGGEYLVGDHVPIRLGYRFDQGAKLHTLSFGGGYIGAEFSIEAALKRTLSSPEGATTLLFSLEYFFEAPGLVRAATAELQ